MIEKIENWIKENAKSDAHWLRTIYWLEQIYPKADEAMKIASLGHDIGRAFPMREGEIKVKNNDTWDFEEYLLWHGKRSAEFLGNLLKENGADEELIHKIEPMVIYHELGGNEKTDAIKDADSISFLENNVDKFVESIDTEGKTKEIIKNKFDYMYNRISLKKAKELAEPFYEKAIEKLNNH